MNRVEVMERVATWFGIESEDGTFNINSYDWQAGCYTNTLGTDKDPKWMCLAEVVYLIEDIMEELED